MSLGMDVRRVAIVQKREKASGADFFCFWNRLLLLEQTFLPMVREKDALIHSK